MLIKNPSYRAVKPLTGLSSDSCKALTFAGMGSLGYMARECLSIRHNGVYTKGKGKSHLRSKPSKRQRQERRDTIRLRNWQNDRITVHSPKPMSERAIAWRKSVGFTTA